MNKIRFLLTFLLLTTSVAHLFGGPITAVADDGVRFEVEEGVLKTSGSLKNMLEDCDEIEERVLKASGMLKNLPEDCEVSLGKSSEDFRSILPFLESIHESKCNIQELLSKKESSEIARIIELANYFDVSQIIDHGSNVLKGRLDTICRQYQEGSEGDIKSFLASMKPLSPQMNQLVVDRVVKDSLATTWLFNRWTISSEILQKEEQLDGWIRSTPLISSNGKIRAVASGETVKIWDVKTGQSIHTLSGHVMGIGSLAFTPDGNYLAIELQNGTTIIYNVGWLNELKRYLSRGITLKQAVMLTLFYENRNNEKFINPEYFVEDFKLLPGNIKKALQGNIEAFFINKTLPNPLYDCRSRPTDLLL